MNVKSLVKREVKREVKSKDKLVKVKDKIIEVNKVKSSTLIKTDHQTDTSLLRLRL